MKLFDRLLTEVPLVLAGSLQVKLAAARTASGTDYEAASGAKPAPKMTVDAEGIATIPIEGMLARKPDAFELANGVTDSAVILDLVEAAHQDRKIKGVLLDVDSPGGFVTGGPEVADCVRRMSKSKPVVAWTGGMMASLAYYIGSQASEVIASRSAQVGSIGVIAAHVDYSSFYESIGISVEVFRNKEATLKAPGAFGLSLTNDQREHIQEQIQSTFGDFRRAVKTARPQVKDEAMHGQVFTGFHAYKAGLASRVGDRHFALSILRSLRS